MEKIISKLELFNNKGVGWAILRSSELTIGFSLLFILRKRYTRYAKETTITKRLNAEPTKVFTES